MSNVNDLNVGNKSEGFKYPICKKKVGGNASLVTQTEKRVDKMFKPMEQKPLTLSEATRIIRETPQCHHNGEICTCSRSLQRNKQIKTVTQRNSKRDQTIESKRGDMMGFVFGMEQGREIKQTQLEAEAIHNQFMNSILEENNDVDAVEDNKSQIVEEQLLLEQYIEQDELELNMLLDSLTLK